MTEEPKKPTRWDLILAIIQTGIAIGMAAFVVLTWYFS